MYRQEMRIEASDSIRERRAVAEVEVPNVVR
jgi:hypothetical protein